MGTWDTSLKGNDTFLDIYSNFFERYNKGDNPFEVSKSILRDFAAMFEDVDDKNNCLLGLALAQWETQSLDKSLFYQVKQIIETGNDLEVWRSLGADDKTIHKRKLALDKFLNQISVEKQRPKKRVTPKFQFESIDLVNITAPDNNKKFTISESFRDKKYIHTLGMMSWNNSGGSVLYFTSQGNFITEKWLDSQTLEIEHDKDIQFSKKDDTAYFCGDKIKITYRVKSPPSGN